jgi:hypothetical protein
LYIFYIIYLSSSNPLFSDKDLSDILTKSRINNTLKNITGLLLYHEGSILQVLEGEEETVMGVYNHIKNDHRHYGIIKMLSGRSQERNFPEWSMGFKTVSDIEWSELSGFLKMDPATIISKLKPGHKEIGAIVNSFVKSSARY